MRERPRSVSEAQNHHACVMNRARSVSFRAWQVASQVEAAHGWDEVRGGTNPGVTMRARGARVSGTREAQSGQRALAEPSRESYVHR